MDIRFVRISSLIFLNFFSTSPRKSSIASASLLAASLGGAVAAAEVELEAAVETAVCGRESVGTDIVVLGCLLRERLYGGFGEWVNRL